MENDERCSCCITADLEKEKEQLLDLKKRLTEIIARNLTAWDTSKDKKIGLLPEVYLSNKSMYKELTGEEYNFSKAVKKFNI
jgi:hypothetical protein